MRPPYPGARHGVAARFARRTVLQVHHRPAVPASLPCPSSHLQAQVTNGRDRGAEPRLTRDAVPRTSRGTPALAAPRPSRMQRPGGKGRRGPLRLRGPAPRPSPALRRVSALPSPPHLGSHLVGAEAGPEAPGGPRARTIHGVPGVRGRLPRPVSSPGSAPRSRLREGERREGAGAEEGKRRRRAPAHNGPAAAQAPLCGSAPAPGQPAGALPARLRSLSKMKGGRTECGLRRMRGM